MDFRRALLAISLGLVLLLIWQAWLDYERTNDAALVPAQQVEQLELPETPIARPQTDSAPVPQAPDSPAAPATPGELPTPAQDTGSLVTVETDLFKIRIDMVGGQILDSRPAQVSGGGRDAGCAFPAAQEFSA